MAREHVLFVTGKLAEPALRRIVHQTAAQHEFAYSICVLPITVAALATTAWIARRLNIPPDVTRIILPGMCNGDVHAVQEKTTKPVEKGPKDLRDLPEYFGGRNASRDDYGGYDIEIIAEINHAMRWNSLDLLAECKRFQADGADVIDLGCSPGETWNGIGDVVRKLRDHEIRVSVDSFNSAEVKAAAANGAELVLSVNRTNVDAAADWGCEVVAIPDAPGTLDGFDETIASLEAAGVRYRLDPILEPIGFGFAASLQRYAECRRRYPEANMMMGVGNLTELTDVDSAGVNVILTAICQELRIGSVLTTQVINWCRSCVRELDLARRLVYHANRHQTLPKHVEPQLLMLRDPKIREHGRDVLQQLAAQVTDRNFRIFAEQESLQVFNDKMFLEGSDPFKLFDEMSAKEEIDPAHAFYLGYEMAKAALALTLDKNYVQDQALKWGFLTREEESHRGK